MALAHQLFVNISLRCKKSNIMVTHS